MGAVGMLSEPSTLGTGLTRYERGRVDTMIAVAARLRRMADDANCGSVDAADLLAYASRLDRDVGLVSLDGLYSTLGSYNCLIDRELTADDLIGANLFGQYRMPRFERMCVRNVLEGSAVDIARVLDCLRGEQFALYAEDLLEVSRHLLDIAERCLLAPGEEDGDE